MGVIATVILIVIVIVIIMIFFWPNDTRYNPFDLLANPGQLMGNAINKFELIRDYNYKASAIPCLASDRLCPHIRQPFVTPCGKTCRDTFGAGWKSGKESTELCQLFPATKRQICVRANE